MTTEKQSKFILNKDSLHLEVDTKVVDDWKRSLKCLLFSIIEHNYGDRGAPPQTHPSSLSPPPPKI
jgi:hypothetical protein